MGNQCSQNCNCQKHEIELVNKKTNKFNDFTS